MWFRAGEGGPTAGGPLSNPGRPPRPQLRPLPALARRPGGCHAGEGPPLQGATAVVTAAPALERPRLLLLLLLRWIGRTFRVCCAAVLCAGNEQIAFMANWRTAEGGLVENFGAKGPKLFRLVMPQRLFDQIPSCSLTERSVEGNFIGSSVIYCEERERERVDTFPATQG